MQLIPQSVEIVQDDALLLAQIRNGSAEAFAMLYARYKQPVYLYCVRMMGDQDAAGDIFQDVFIKSYEHMRQGTSIENVKAYLFTAARNRCLNAIRDRKKMYDFEELPEDLAPQHQPDYGVAESIREALERLPPMNREAFLLCEYQGYSYEEAAAMTRVPVSTVRKRIFRARQRLRSLLQREDFL